jgi:predicted PurR-regulated permease PerM
LAVAAVVAGLVIVGLLLGFVVQSSIVEFTRQLPTYQQQLTSRLEALLSATEVSQATVKELLATIDPGQAMNLAAGMLNSVSGLLSNAFLVVLTMVFMILELAIFPQKLRAAVPDARRWLNYYTTVVNSLKRYIALKTGISLFTGIIVWSWVSIMGVGFASLWGLLAFLLNYIPNIGSILAAIPAVLIAFIQFGLTKALIVAAGYVVLNVCVGNLIEPRIMGQGLGISTLVVFMSLIFWGWIFGPIGMLLSVPLTMTVKIALDSDPRTRWIAILMDSKVPEPPQPEPEKAEAV